MLWDPVAVKELLRGYTEANEFMEAERIERLAHMTPEEALAIWRDMTAGWEASPLLHKGLERLDLWQVEALVDVRRTFERLARTKGLP